MIPLAFYAPLKSPDHPVPSGDRTMANLLWDALVLAGFSPVLASRLGTRDGVGDPTRQAAIATESGREAELVAAAWAAAPAEARPQLWFTYHSYYKAPDHLGPALAGRFGIPYVLAEASRARKRAAGPWAAGHAAAEAALAAAARVICLTENDRDALAADPAFAGRLVRLPPFTRTSTPPSSKGISRSQILAANSPCRHPEEPAPRASRRAFPGRDPGTHTGHACFETGLTALLGMTNGGGSSSRSGSQEDVGAHPGWPSGPARPSLPGREAPRLLAVGMMREGDKLASFRLLADALQRIADRPWTLAVAGDGPARPAVAAAFASFGSRVTLLGALEPAALRSLYAAADLLVWPAVNEAFGMALLEAQAAGCPVVAGAFGGVADACLPGRTALLTPPGDAAAFADAVAGLLDDPARLARMGEDAARFVAAERSVEQAAASLAATLRPLLGAARTAA